MTKNINLIGKKIGKLTVIQLDHIKTKFYDNRPRDYKYYRCLCDCGNEKIVVESSLIKGVTKSCGCLHKKRAKEANIKHGLKGTRIYNIWRNMKSRCLNEKDFHYKYYGQRGITICNEWINDIKSFHDWAIKNGYAENLTIDRIDVNGNYEPSNCRWVPQYIQNRNTRKNIIINYQGEKHCLKDWCNILDLNYQKALRRISQLKWEPEKALTIKN